MRYTGTMRSATLLATAVLLAGCGGDTSGIVRLRAATERTPAQALEEFAREAERLSGGGIRVEPEFDVTGSAQGIAAKVASGELELAMVPAESFDAEGIKGLRALHAPFLVTTDALLARIALSPLAGEMLAELDDAGLFGLALVPIGLLHPFWHVTALADFAGTSIYAPRSDVAFALFRALGARPNEGRRDALADDTPPDSVVRDTASFPPTPRGTRGKTVTANVTFAPKRRCSRSVAGRGTGSTESAGPHCAKPRGACSSTRSTPLCRRPSARGASALMTGGSRSRRRRQSPNSRRLRARSTPSSSATRGRAT